MSGQIIGQSANLKLNHDTSQPCPFTRRVNPKTGISSYGAIVYMKMDTDSGKCPTVATVSALLVTALTTVLTFLKPSERSEIHKAAAGQYHALRNRVRRFREIELDDGLEGDKAKERLFKLAADQDDLNQNSLSISRCDYEKAKRDIDEGRSQYRVDQEGG